MIKNNYFIKATLVLIFIYFVGIFTISTIGMFININNRTEFEFHRQATLISTGIIGVFLYLKLIYDKIR